jgi:hypothetical protein
MDDSRSDQRARARDLGLARLRRSTRLSIVGATALAGAFAGAAAHSNPGHKAPAVAAKQRTSKATAPVPQVQTPATTTLPPAAAQPPPPPVATTVPPVATTGAT